MPNKAAHWPESPDRPRVSLDIAWRKLSRKDRLPTLTDPLSPASEQFRMLRARLDGARTVSGQPLQVVAVSSALPQEGKTSTALNLAIVAAQEMERPVAFVECDLRRPRARTLMEQSPAEGLTDVLRGRRHVENVMLYMKNPGRLMLLLAGTSTNNPVGLLGSMAMGQVIQWLRERHGQVIIDTPPALHFADAARIAPHVDAFLLVARSGLTPRDALVKTHRSLAPFGVTGIVLNDFSSQSSGYYQRYGYGQTDEELDS